MAKLVLISTNVSNPRAFARNIVPILQVPIIVSAMNYITIESPTNTRVKDEIARNLGFCSQINITFEICRWMEAFTRSCIRIC